MAVVKESEKFVSNNVLEGMVSVRAVLESIDAGINSRRILTLYFAQEKIRSRNGDFRYLKARSYDLGYAFSVVPMEEIDRMCIGNTHGGVAAECSERPLPSLPSALPAGGFFVLLDGIEDPYNFGYALRSLYAAGADGILLPERNWLSSAGIVCRASAGASERFAAYECDPAEAVQFFRDHGYRVVCTGLENAVSMYDADMKRPLLLVIGGEKRGISAQVQSLAHQIVCIEYGRDYRCSLSAASAAAVLGFEVFRQNRA